MGSDCSKEDLAPLLNVLLSPPSISDEESPEDPTRFTEAEVRALQQLRKKSRASVRRRGKLFRQLEEVETRISKEQASYGAIFNASSAIDSLSDDILATIFWTAFREGKTEGCTPFYLPEVVISHVCSRWRAISLSMAALWSFFCYGFHVRRGVIRVDRLEAYLARSKQYPLDLWFQLPEDDDYPIVQQFQDEVLPLIMAETHRWRRCQFVTSHQETMEKISAYLSKLPTAPALEALIPILTRDGDGVYDGEDPTVMKGWNPNILLSGAPKLEFLQLDEISVRFFRPPLQSIVHLRLEMHLEVSLIKFSCSTLDDILVLPRLETLSIWSDFISFTQESFDSRTSTITAEKLKHFRTDGKDLPHYFLCHVAAPALETFVVYSIGLSSRRHATITPRFPSIHTVTLYAVSYLTHGSIDMRRLIESLFRVSTAKMLVISELSHAFASELKAAGTFQCVEDLVVEGEDFEAIQDAVSAFPKLKRLTIDVPFYVSKRSSGLESLKREWSDRSIEVTEVNTYEEPHRMYPLWPPGVEWMSDNGQEGWGTGRCEYNRFESCGYF